MIQIAGRPPNYEKILAVLPGAAGPGVIFAYAPDVYVPSGKKLPPELVAHESAHIQRQAEIGVEAWWDRYLADKDFRYKEELIAHACEYDWLCRGAKTRASRRFCLKQTVRRLCSGLYGTGVTMERATEDLIGMRNALSQKTDAA